MSSLDRELQGHRKQWERTVRSLEEHRLKVAELSGQEQLLLKDVEEKANRVAELEALLGEVLYSGSNARIILLSQLIYKLPSRLIVNC